MPPASCLDEPPPKEAPLASAASAKPVRPASRWVFLDALRGFDMFWIIGAGTILESIGKGRGGALGFIAAQLEHVEWIGFHFEDLIFPLFLCIMGVSLVLSLDRVLAERGVRGAVVRIVRRSVLLFLLGMFYYGGFSKPWPDVQVCGVLPRIAICYLLVGLIYCWVRSPKALGGLAAGLLLGYWALLAWTPFPALALDEDYIEPIADRIGSHDPAAIAAAAPERIRGLYEEELNLANYLDFLYLPGRKAEQYYVNEGLLSTLPSLAIPIFGVLVGLYLRDSRGRERKELRLLAVGVAMIALGSLWGLWFPMIKRIWTSSFCLSASGWSLVLIAAFYYLVEVRGWRRWCEPFVWIGCNPITLYLSETVINYRSLASRFVGGDIRAWLDRTIHPGVGGAVNAAVALLLVVGLARFLYRRQIFIKV